MLRVLKAEFLKLRRARVVLGTVATVVTFAVFGIYGAGIWGSSATPTWSGVLAESSMFMAGWWGILIFSLAAAHLFGGEFADGTAGSMLTTPVRREYFLIAKFAVLAVWILGLVLVSVVCHMAAAVIRGATGFTWSLVGETLRDNLEVALLMYLTLPVTAFISMLGRGYVAPMLFATAAMAVSWSAGFLGWARWFPWAMPSTIGGGLGPPSQFAKGLVPASWAIIIALFAAGVIAVFAYVNRAGEVAG